MTWPAANSGDRLLEKPRAILFDWDNTLVDTWDIIEDALNTTMRAFGLPRWSGAEVRTRVRKSLRDSFPGLFGDNWEKAGEVFYERYQAIHAEKLTAVSGAREMLGDLASLGIYLGVVSNKRNDFLRTEIDHLGWAHLFGGVVGATDAVRDKPAPEPVHLALQSSGLVPGAYVWLAGDADIDMECAVNSGCTPVLVRGHEPAPGEFGPHAPAWHFTDCQALSKFIRNL